ncbi:MAG: hypothetical protein DHS20C15_33540 [Planctomycetota bacterium]|nr:MAG: hypothetical protein DHS20C15_33540 [Planctomycetota bacterium]
MAVFVLISAGNGSSWRVLVLAAGLFVGGLAGPLATQEPPAPVEPAQPEAPAGPSVHRASASASSAEAAPTIVTPLRTTGGQLSVQVLVNGAGPYLFTLDSGSGMSVCLDAELAETLGLPTVGEVLNSDGSGTVVPRALVGIDHFVLGGHDFGAQQALVADYRFVSGSGADRVMGILGLPLFDGGVVTLDAPREELRWPDAALELGEHTVRYTTPGGIPEISMRVGERSWRGVVDTGFSGTASFPDSLRGVLELAGEARVVGEARGPNGARGHKVWGATLAGTLEFAGHRVDAPEVYFIESRRAPYLGGQLLRRYALSFDTRERLLAVRGE